MRAASETVFQASVIELFAATVVALALKEMICGAGGVLVATGVLVGVKVALAVDVEVKLGV